MKSKMSFRRYAALYTALFALFCLGFFLPFLLRGKGLAWYQDGAPQYLPYLAYTGRYFRDLAGRALQGDFSIHTFDFMIGQGSDVGTIMRAHPLDYLSILVPVRYTEVLYTVIFLLRMYLAGWCFSGFAFLWKDPSASVLTASMLYVFSGYTVYFGPRHTFFITAMIIFPLLLTGAERILRRESGLLFAFSAFAGFMGNYYFMYMCSIGMGIYVLIRFADLWRDQGAGEVLRMVPRLLLPYLLGTCMAMTTLLPIICNLAASSRLSYRVGPEHLLHWSSWREYYRIILYLAAPVLAAVNRGHLNLALPVLGTLAVLAVSGKGKHRILKRGCAAAALLLLVPAGSYMMSGFSDTNARWVFMVVFLAGMVFCLCEESLLDMGRKEKRALVLMTVLIAAFALLDQKEGRRIYLAWTIGGLLLMDAVLLAAPALPALRGKLPVILTGLVFFSCVSNAFFLYNGRFEDGLSEFADAGKGLAYLTDSEFFKLSRIEDDSFWRADSNLITSGRENASLLADYRGLSMYNSTLSGPITLALAEQENIGLAGVHRFQGMDGHTAAEELANVKYYLTTKDGEQHVPYGYEKAEAYSDEGNDIYVNQHPLPFGYSYDKVISREAYDPLTAAQKEQVLLEAVLLDEVPDGMEQISTPSAAVETVDIPMPETGEGVERTENGYRASQRNAQISVPFERRKGYEVYLRLIGLSYPRSYTFVDVTASDLHSVVTTRGTDEKFSLNLPAFMVKLGVYRESGEDRAVITFRRKGAYELTGIQIVYVPLDLYEEQIGRLSKVSMENVLIEGNHITGSVRSDAQRIMVFSVPFSTGWSAEMDGEKVPLLRANTGYTGIRIPEGEHRISLTYRTPGGKTGALTALAAWLVFAGLLIRQRRRRKPV